MTRTCPYMDRGLSVQKLDGVALISFSRPERLNAMTPDMEMALRDAVENANGDKDIRAVMITGSGKAFCAGADLLSVREGNYYEKQKALLARALATPGPYKGRFSYLSLSPKPVVAAINGAAIGVGVTIALHCDIRLGQSGAKLSLAFSRLGLAAEEGVALLLPRLIGGAAAFDLLLSGRTFSADYAREAGLISTVFSAENFEEKALEHIQEMVALCSPDAMRRIKKQVWNTMLEGYPEAIELARQEVTESRQGADFKEAVASFAEKRTPDYPSLSVTDPGLSLP